MSLLLVRDTTLYFQEVGRGDSLLFIHGVGGDANIWDEQTMSLADEFRCVTYDRRGHTRSPLGTITQPSATTHADDAAELIIALGLSPVIVVGADRGAEVGLDLARRYAGLVSRAVLSEPLINSLEPGSTEEFSSTIVRAVQSAPSSRAAVDAFFKAVSGGSWERLPQARREAARSNHAALVSALLVTSSVLTPADLQAITIPVRIIMGMRTPSPLPADSRDDRGTYAKRRSRAPRWRRSPRQRGPTSSLQRGHPFVRPTIDQRCGPIWGGTLQARAEQRDTRA